MILISHQTKSIVVPFRNDISQLFPHARQFDWQGSSMLMLPHGLDETKLLRNLDMHVPAPITEHYQFPSADGKRPFDKQALTAASMTMNPRSYVLNGMGTGKTKSAVWAFDYLRSIGQANKMLVVAPLSTLNFTWAREVFMTIPRLRVKVLFDALQKRRDVDVICFDEAAVYRNARADRSKIARKLAAGRRYVWAMTGSPTPSGPTDAYGLAHLLFPDTAPRSFNHFRQETMLQVSQFKWVPKKDAHETVAKLLQPAVRFSLDDIIELPQLYIPEPQEVPIGTRQKQVYDSLRDHASALLKEGTITAANGGVVFSKMLQVSLGWVYGDKDHEVFELDNQARVAALLDIIDAAERKVIVFSPFKSAIAGIDKALTKHGIDHANVTGDVPHGRRTEIFSAFQDTEKYRVINAHPDCMSHGLTLTAADTIVWFGPVTKLETFEQANARITRVGQAHKQQIIRLVGTPAERLVYRRLEQKQDLQDTVLDIIAAITAGE